jgi:predicted ATPase
MGDAEVAAQLERVLASRLFTSSRRLSAFLRFIVEATLRQRTAGLKESVLGVEVFGRNAGYNPQEDPVVRVMAGRLRSRLAEYYHSEGVSDPVIFELPRGGYVPTWHGRENGRAAVVTRAPNRPLPPTSSSSYLVGRDRELLRLRNAFSAASTGVGHILTVSGDAGIGKTALLQSFLGEIEGADLSIWAGYGRCSERLAGTEPFAPAFELLDSLQRSRDGGRSLDLMRAAAPTWHATFVGEANGDEKAPRSHERLRREFLTFVENLANERPVVLVLEDMHWADPSTCDLMGYLGVVSARHRVLLVMTYRPAPVMARQHPFLQLRLDLERRGLCEEIALESLSGPDVDRYIAGQFPGNRFPDEFAPAVHERSEGHPLFMTDMLRFLRDRAMISNQNGVWTLQQGMTEIRAVIPSGVTNMIRLEMSHFTENDRIILACASVQGVEFDSAVIARALDQDVAAIEERLRELQLLCDFIRAAGEFEYEKNIATERYRFVHVFYQNVFYDWLTPARRFEFSLRIAKALENFSGPKSADIASQLCLLFETAKEYPTAAKYFVQAARHAARIFAYQEAAILCERGLAALAKSPSSFERDALELKIALIRGMCLMNTEGYASPKTEEAHQRSRELCVQFGEKKRLVPVLWGLHTCYANRGALKAALAIALEMKTAARQAGDPVAMVESLHALGTTFAFTGRLTEARVPLETILEQYPRGGYAFQEGLYILDPWVTALSMLARLLVYMGYLDQGIRRAEESRALAVSLGHPPSIAYATFWVGWIQHAIDAPLSACVPLAEATEISMVHGPPQIVEWARLVHGSALARTGRLSEGIAAMQNAIAGQDAIFSLLERPYCLTLLAEAHSSQGDYEAALALCKEALQLGRETEGRCYEAETHRVRAEILLRAGSKGRLSDAETDLERALALARSSQARLLELRAAISYFRLREGTGAEDRAIHLNSVLSGLSEGAGTPVVSLARELADKPSEPAGSSAGALC